MIIHSMQTKLTRHCRCRCRRPGRYRRPPLPAAMRRRRSSCVISSNFLPRRHNGNPLLRLYARDKVKGAMRGICPKSLPRVGRVSVQLFGNTMRGWVVDLTRFAGLWPQRAERRTWQRDGGDDAAMKPPMSVLDPPLLRRPGATRPVPARDPRSGRGHPRDRPRCARSNR